MKTKNRKTKKRTVTILWGSGGISKQTYSFKTEAEKAAFLKGVDEASGWLNYEVLEDGDE